MAGGAECDPLLLHRRVGLLVVIGADQAVDVHELVGVEQMTRLRAHVGHVSPDHCRPRGLGARRGEVLRKPVAGQGRYALQRARFLEEVAGSRHDLEPRLPGQS